MLIKVKIKYEIYQSGEDLLKDTNDCIQYMTELKEQTNYYLKTSEDVFDGKKDEDLLETEMAFLLKETLKTVETWAIKKKKDLVWQ